MRYYKYKDLWLVNVMKICNHCNAENLDTALFCDSCGVKFDVDDLEINEAEEITNEPIDIDVEPINSNPQPTDWRPAFKDLNGVSTRRSQGGLTAFSILNICSIIFTAFTLYATIFTAIFGIIAIVNLNKAKREPNEEHYKIYKKNALILNIVGLVIGCIGFLCFIGLVAFAIANSLEGLGAFGEIF